MNVIYFKDTGRIMTVVSKLQDYKTYYGMMPQDFIDSLNQVTISDIPNDILMDIDRYKIVDDDFVELSDIEMEEFLRFNRILTEEERVNNRLLERLLPSSSEIQDAENTIKILELLSEVL